MTAEVPQTLNCKNSLSEIVCVSELKSLCRKMNTVMKLVLGLQGIEDQCELFEKHHCETQSNGQSPWKLRELKGVESIIIVLAMIIR